MNNFPTPHEHVEIRQDCKLCGAKSGSEAEQHNVEQTGLCLDCINT